MTIKLRALKDIPKSSRFWMKFNLYSTFFWLAMIPFAFLTGLAKQTSFVTLISLIALALATQSSWQSSRIEFKADVRDPDTDVEDVKGEL